MECLLETHGYLMLQLPLMAFDRVVNGMDFSRMINGRFS